MALTLIDLGIQSSDGSLTNAKIANTTITNAKISASAAIDYSKLATLTDGNLLIGNGSNVATSVNPSGDIDVTNAGVFSISSGVIVNADVNASAAIVFSKLAALTDGNLLIGNGSNVATSVNPSGDIDVTNAGVFSISSGVIVDADVNASAALAFSKLAALTDGNILVGNGSNVAVSVNPSGDIDISNAGVFSIGSGVIVNADVNASAAIALSKLAEAVIQADGGQAFTADQSMGSNKLTSLTDGTVASDAVNKGQLDAAVAGLKWKDSVTVATTANIALSGEQTIDGILTSADRVLVKDQSSGAENGIYVSAAGAWSRSTDADTAAELEGAAVFVQQGSVNADNGFTQTADGITLDSTSLVWVIFTSTNGDATTLDGLDSLQFLRSDANDSVTTGVTLNMDSGSTLSIDGNWDIGGTQVTSTATELNILDGVTSTTAELNILDGVTASTADLNLTTASLLRSGQSDSFTSGTLTMGNGTTLDLTDATLDCSDPTGTYQFNEAVDMTATSTELNLLDGATVTTTELNNLGTIVTREVPTGAVDSSNRYYLLAAAPIAGTESVHLNGVEQDDDGNSAGNTAGSAFNFTNGSATVTTNNTTGLIVGDVITSSNDDALGVIDTVNSNTSVVLSAVWDGATASTDQAQEITVADDYAIRGKSFAFNTAPSTNSKVRASSRN